MPHNGTITLKNEQLHVSITDHGVIFSSPLCTAFLVGPLQPSLTIGEKALLARGVEVTQSNSNGCELWWTFENSTVALKQSALHGASGTVHIRSEFVNSSTEPVHLNNIRLLGGNGVESTHYGFGSSLNPRFYEQNGYTAQVRSYRSEGSSAGVAEDPSQSTAKAGTSQHCWVSYDAGAPFAWLAGFETADRWDGRIIASVDDAGEVAHWEIGFDGGDVLVDAGQTILLEDVIFLAGRVPYSLLESYADIVALRHKPPVLPCSPVSWCSWYPYRLGVTEEKVLANARMASQYLKPLGLEIMEVDLGWEQNYLPSSYEENPQFPHGLKWLSDELQKLDLRLGLWKAPFTISEFDAVFREHPEWLLGTTALQPAPLGTWFWEPHGRYYGLDLTHPEAQQWLRQQIRSLLARGASYLKLDFLGCGNAPGLRRRFDRHMVAGGGNEATRLGMRIIAEEASTHLETPLILNCGLPDLPGQGQPNLLYACQDTGNTGYSGMRFLRDDYGKNLAGHLWKNRHWGIIQPSCLCVGLPGTLEETRLRATATFLCGGQVDISDDLTSLPEDRWQILFRTLPPLGRAAKPIDLFDAIPCSSFGYEAFARGEFEEKMASDENADCSRVWHLMVETDWDTWQLLGLFNYDSPQGDGVGSIDLITSFQIPTERIGLEKDETYWIFEFWSGQFLGTVPRQAKHSLTPQGYRHPGDMRNMLSMSQEDRLDVSFFGPAVKLLAYRKVRPHPWVVGTSFHQSCGTELHDVRWLGRESGGILTGELHRPAGHRGDLFIAGCDRPPAQVFVDGKTETWRHAANGSIAVSIESRSAVTSWRLLWD